MNRRSFMKLLGISVLASTTGNPLYAAGQPSNTNKMLWLQRGDDNLKLNIGTTEGYQGACWILRDTTANKSAWASMELLETLAWMQAWLAAYQVHKPFIVHSGFRTKYTNELAGGAKASLHMRDGSGFFHAADIRVPGISAEYIGRLAALAHQGGVGFYTNRKLGFTHVDDGRVRYWRGSAIDESKLIGSETTGL